MQLKLRGGNMGKRFKALIEEKGKDDFFEILSNHPEGMELKIELNYLSS